jgi:hypothetical protein
MGVSAMLMLPRRPGKHSHLQVIPLPTFSHPPRPSPRPADGRWCYFRDAEDNIFEIKERSQQRMP